MKNKKVLVTGGAGYIGAHAVVELVQNDYEVIIIDNFSKTDATLLRGIERITGKPVNFYEGDCRDEVFLKGVFESEGAFGCVLHFAAFKSVSESVQEPLKYYDNNIGSLLTLLRTMKSFNTTDLIFSSSCTVYGQPDVIPVNENSAFKKAESPYGATKQLCERILEDSFREGFRIISLRYFNPIGAHHTAEIGEMPVGTPSNLVPYITQTAAGKRQELTIYGGDYQTPDGTCIRDYIHVVDVATAHVKAMEYLNDNMTNPMLEIFNLGTGVGVSVLELVKQFIEVTGQNLPYTIGPRRPGDVEKVFADSTKLNKAFRWKTQYSVSDALLHAWQWEKKLLAVPQL
jgi:UDP-glucose 4-epimerase